MSSPGQLAIGQKLDAISLRMQEMERELAALRQDMQRLARLLEQSGVIKGPRKSPADDTSFDEG